MGKIVREDTSNKFSKFATTSIVSNIIVGIVGALMFFSPELTNKTIGLIVGILFLISGINIIYKFFKRNGAKLYSLNLFFGLILFIIGLLIIIVPFSVASFITVCLGIYIIVLGSNKISYGFWIKVGNDSSWLITITTGIIEAILGIMVLINPFASLTITKIVGIFLMLSAALELSNSILLRKRYQEITKIFW